MAWILCFLTMPGSEAPAELTFSIPSLKLYNGAEILSHTMHNLYTLGVLKSVMP